MYVNKLKPFLEQLLFAAHIFVAILLLAENRLAIPDWLHVVGRLHPLLLHFPIVLLLMGLLLLLFPKLISNSEERLSYGRFLLLLGCAFSAITVIAGLFLSLEDGEQTAAIQNHKWTGVALFWMTSLLYWLFSRLEKNPILFKTVASLSIVLILITGHFGASLTHGENFITGPLYQGKVELVSLEDAEVFSHVIRPILENKCIGCHKASKQKGELRLDLQEYILKGGESGAAVVPGDVEKSILAHHILLPLEDEKHMPPEGKPQLNEEEKELLISWIESGGDFKKKVLAYGHETAIFQLASLKFENLPPTYSFQAADANKISALNSFYRKVTSLGAGSPALSVSYFSRQNFKPESLTELHETGKQVVILNLNNMPVVDADLKQLTAFVNLEKLYLNYSEIKGEGLKQLISLKNLSVLSLTGNPLDQNSLAPLEEMQGLKKLYLWDTGLDQVQLADLKKKLPDIYIETGFVDDGTVYQLNPPQLKFDKAFFEEQARVEIIHPIKSTAIYYTEDGSTPDSVNSKLYREPLSVDSNTVIKARAFADGWIGSIGTEAEFIKASIRPAKYLLIHPPADRYKGDLVNSLFDGKKAVADIWNLAWLGFIDTPMEVEMEFEKAQNIDSLQLSIWYNGGARFFPPAEVEIWTMQNDNKWEKILKYQPPTPNKTLAAGLRRIPIPFKTSAIQKMKLVAKPALLPSWHGKSGQKAWLMIDEVVIN